MGVQRYDQGGPFQNDADAGMLVTVNTTFVPLGTTKESFQIQVVTRQIGPVVAHEKAGGKGVHRLGHRLPHRLVRALEASLEGPEESPTLFHVAAVRIERGGDLADVLDACVQSLLLRLDVGETPVNGVGQALQSLLRRSPFFTSRFRCREDRISPRASAIFNPGGCNGPPWSSLSTPRTAAQ